MDFQYYRDYIDARVSVSPRKSIIVEMKGTEVPNPRRISACDCTCVLTRLSCDSCLLCAFCFVPAYAKFIHKFLTLFHRPCATYL